jgi:hypothetical protein
MLAGESGHASCCPAAPPFTIDAKMSFLTVISRQDEVKRLEEVEKFQKSA